MQPYDFIIVGGGAAGLSLACQVIQSPLRDRSILIIDKDTKQRNDRTCCFWTDRPTRFDDIVCHSWSRLQVVCRTDAVVADLQPYRYQMIRAIDLYRFIQQKLAAFPNVEFVQGTVERIDDGNSHATVYVDRKAYTAHWVFDYS